MRYDLTLKDLFHNQPRRLLKLLTGCAGGRPLTVEYPEVRQRRPDLVLELDDGRIYHLEIQSGPDPEMPWRMLEYYTLIRRTHDRIPVQQILYVGEPPIRLMDRIEESPLQFHYQVVDIRTIDCRELLESPEIEDNLLALLCRMEDETHAVRAILERIAALAERPRRDALQKLLILSGLRPLKTVIRREVEKMPIALNLQDNEFFREAFEEGMEKGREEGREEEGRRLLEKMARLRFGPLPEWALSKLEGATREELERWGERLVQVERLEEVFD